jgi:hypothetical protein
VVCSAPQKTSPRCAGIVLGLHEASILLHVWSYTKLCMDVLKYLPLCNNE